MVKSGWVSWFSIASVYSSVPRCIISKQALAVHGAGLLEPAGNRSSNRKSSLEKLSGYLPIGPLSRLSLTSRALNMSLHRGVELSISATRRR